MPATRSLAAAHGRGKQDKEQKKERHGRSTHERPTVPIAAPADEDGLPVGEEPTAGEPAEESSDAGGHGHEGGNGRGHGRGKGHG